MTTFNVGGLRLPRPFRIRRIGHVGYHAPDANATAGFLAAQLGLMISDIDDFTTRVPQLSKADATGWFLRCNTDHHTVVIGSQALVAVIRARVCIGGDGRQDQGKQWKAGAQGVVPNEKMGHAGGGFWTGVRRGFDRGARASRSRAL